MACSDENKPTFEDEQTLDEETQLNVSYGDNPQQKYDLYLPEGRSSEKTKVIILIHGGGWIDGDKEDMSEYIPILKEKHPDHAIVNINYVLANPPSTPAFPNQFLDLGQVINKLTQESEELELLPEFGLIGASAGAHIALQYDYVYDTDDKVKMVCDIVGPTDFTDPFYTENPNFQVLLNALVDESAYPQNSNIAELISPALQVTKSSSPTILFYGDKDPLVPLSNGEKLQTILSDNMISNSFTVYEGGHGDWSQASNIDLQDQLTSFITEYLPIE
tara:strand:- start:23939 stop:24766 length:828 start_codon:yes stop_codon:yes gene_type:complete